MGEQEVGERKLPATRAGGSDSRDSQVAGGAKSARSSTVDPRIEASLAVSQPQAKPDVALESGSASTMKPVTYAQMRDSLMSACALLISASTDRERADARRRFVAVQQRLAEIEPAAARNGVSRQFPSARAAVDELVASSVSREKPETKPLLARFEAGGAEIAAAAHGGADRATVQRVESGASSSGDTAGVARQGTAGDGAPLPTWRRSSGASESTTFRVSARTLEPRLLQQGAR